MRVCTSFSVLSVLAVLSTIETTSASYCSPPPSVSNGGHNGGLSRSFRLGHVLRYRCNSGYRLDGPSEITCIYSRYSFPRYRWNKYPPRCIRVSSANCPKLPSIPNGYVQGTKFSPGSFARYVCNRGYKLSGNEFRKCLLGGSGPYWTGSTPKCISLVKECPTLRNPDNGVVKLTEGRKVGAKAWYICNKGYVLVGSESRTCQRDLTWAPKAPVCKRNQCPQLDKPRFGSVSFSNGLNIGSVATYSCSAGYTLRGDRRRKCQGDRTWTNRAPTCVPIECPSLRPPRAGSISFSNKRFFRSVATYSCDRGYELKGGSAKRTCQANRKWSGDAPSCVLIRCPSLSPPKFGSISFSNKFFFRSMATYSCIRNYEIRGDSKRTCQSNGKWTGEAQTCVRVGCPNLKLEFGIIKFSDAFNVGSQATHVCNKGFTLSGNIRRTCQTDRTWSGQPPICVRTCSLLPDPSFGRVTFTNKQNVGSEARYSCFSGYTLDGDRSRRCQANGKWSGSAPICKPIQCRPLTLRFGTIRFTNDNFFLSVASHECNPGYALVGDKVRVCQANATWRGRPVSCRPIDECAAGTDNCDENAKCMDTRSGFTCTCNSGYTGDGITCTDIDECATGTDNCDRNAKCTNTPGSFFCTCNPGYTGDGVTCTDIDECATGADNCDRNAKCTNTPGSFFCTCNPGYTGDGVTCTDIDECATGADNCDRNAKCTNTPGSFFCTCNPGYTGSGVTCRDIDECATGADNCDSNAKCTNTPGSFFCTCNRGYTGDGVTCTAIECPTLTLRFGIIRFTNLNFFLSVASHECNPGYALVGDKVRVCQANATWRGRPASCRPIDECAAGTDNCDENAKCMDTRSGFTCTCNSGYTGDGITCTDIDECATGTDNCDRNAKCTNTPGSFFCTCNPGYTGDGVTCTDIDECATGADNCDRNAKCTNTPGSFFCTCNPGYTGDGVICTDIDECATGTDNCDRNARCTNTPGSFFCTCNPGYTGSGVTCRDIDECATGADNCDSNAKCTNTPGSFFCTCNPGYTGSGVTCRDIDECATGADNCDSNAKCTNTPGSFFCTCNRGYTGNGVTCTAIECPTLTLRFGIIRFTNLNFYLSVASHECNPGYALVGDKVRVCQANATWRGRPASCRPIDECAAGTDNCDENAKCMDTRSGFTCTCNSGYTGDGITCTDIDECATGADNCDRNAKCTNTPGSFFCTCNSGYTGDGVTCTDIDECATGTDNCDRNAKCTNTPGSFFCTCNPGYTGDGVICTDINECATGTDNCDRNAKCTNTPGSFFCTCNPGYIGSGVTCRDIDECATGADNCDSNAKCTNTPGSFFCTCNRGYTGDGVTCTAIECPALTLRFGIIRFTNLNFFLSVASHECNPGYALVGDKVRVCQANATWRGRPASCRPIDECAAGTDNCDENAKCMDTRSGFTCTCNSGYTGDGITCTDIDECATGADNCDRNAKCTNTPGSFFCTCNSGYTGDGVTCTDINECATGTDNCDRNARCTNTPGSFFCTCNPGYSGNGVVCVADCEPLNNIPFGTVNVSGTSIGSFATYSCIPGYELKGNERRVCQPNSQWSGSVPRCDPVDCGSLRAPQNGIIRLRGTTFRSVATYTCNSGFILAGPRFRVCQANGSWDGSNPRCVADVTCPGLVDPEFGEVTVTGQTPNSIATYTCMSGFILSGNVNRVCQTNGLWDGSDPVCNPVDCGNLTDPENGRVVFTTTTLGSPADYSCLTGFSLQGFARRICIETGLWSDEAPTCEPDECPVLLNPVNGRVAFGDRLFGDRATYTCDPGFFLVGSVNRTCLPGGTWSGGDPTCLRNPPVGGCGDPGIPAFGRRIGSNFSTGAVVFFRCNDDYDLIGDKFRICLDNGAWTGVQPICRFFQNECVKGVDHVDRCGRRCECVNGRFINCCRVRRDYAEASSADRLEFINTILSVVTDPIYGPRFNTLIAKYMSSYDSNNVSQSAVPSESQVFMFNRYFLLEFEDLLKDFNCSLTIFFYDWTPFPVAPYTAAVWRNTDGFGDSSRFEDNCVKTGPFRVGQYSVTPSAGGGCLKREYNNNMFPSRDVIERDLLTYPSSKFINFHRFLHLLVQVNIQCFIGGTMCSSDAANDPVYPLLLSRVDSILTRWQSFGGGRDTVRYSTDARPLLLTPGFAVRDFHDNSNLPYGTCVRYDPPFLLKNPAPPSSFRTVQHLDCAPEKSMMSFMTMTQADHDFMVAECSKPRVI